MPKHQKSSSRNVRQSVANHSKIKCWLADPLASDVGKKILRLADDPDVDRMTVMPDVHLAGEFCVGTVIASRTAIFPAAIGGDIGCGMVAFNFDADAGLLHDPDRAELIIRELAMFVPANRQTADRCHRLPDTLLQESLSNVRLNKLKSRDGTWQLCTLGRGNHFVEFQADEDNRLWAMIHTGSRGIGQAVAAFHLRENQAANPHQKLIKLGPESEAGESFLADLDWARRYASANRMAIVHAVAELFQLQFNVQWNRESLFESDHNHIQFECHDFEEGRVVDSVVNQTAQCYWVHRKGAQRAGDGEMGMVPGSMATASYHTIGRGDASSLHSCSHGAGRTMSRSEAFKAVSQSRLLTEMRNVHFNHRRSRDLRDESPTAYRDVRSVLKAQKNLLKIVRQLRPVLSYKVP